MVEQAVIHYGYSIDYTDPESGHNSSMCGGADTEEQSMIDLEHYKAYYVGIGRVITHAVLKSFDCVECNGSGLLPRPKRGPLKAPWMPLPICKRCKGTGGEKVLYEEGSNG